MDAAAWARTYTEILDDLGYDRRADEAARDLLDELLADALPVDLPALRERIGGREAYVLGGAARPGDMDAIPHGAPLLVADAAAGVALPRARPDAIVTDLDGDIALQVAANALGVPVLLHAHGDNVQALLAHARAFRGPVTGTTQAEAKGRIRNFGGFTDGDRACCLAEAMGASSLALVGFDWDAPAAKAGTDAAMKRRKLAWGRRIVDALGLPLRYVA